MLYFVDFDNYEQHGASVSGMRYVRLQYGPVPHTAEYTPVIQDMIARKKLKIISQIYHGMPQKRYIALSDYDSAMQDAAGEDYLKDNPISKQEYDYYENLAA